MEEWSKKIEGIETEAKDSFVIVHTCMLFHVV